MHPTISASPWNNSFFLTFSDGWMLCRQQTQKTTCHHHLHHLCILGQTATAQKRKRQESLSWLTNKEINIYMRLCMRCCILWLCELICNPRACVYTWDTTFLIGVYIHNATMEPKRVYPCKKENPEHGPIGVAECMFIARVRVVCCVSFTLPRQLTDPFVPRRKSYNITATIQSLENWFLLINTGFLPLTVFSAP